MKPLFPKMFTLVIIGVICFAGTLAADEPEIDWSEIRGKWIATVNWQADVTEGGMLEVLDFLGDIDVEGGASEPGVVISYRFNTRDREEAEEMLEELMPRFTVEENEIIVESPRIHQRRHGWFGGWNNNYNFSATLQASVPRNFSIDVETSGGDVSVIALDGDVEASTSGGDVSCENINGEIDVSTSGGDLDFLSLSGEVSGSTSGGDITAESIEGGLYVSTSGGDLDIIGVTGELDASTSGGDINIRSVTGERVDFSTSGGDIYAREIEASSRCNIATSGGRIELVGTVGKFEAHTSGGNIRSNNHSGDLDLETSGGEVKCLELNGGVIASTVGGDIEVEVVSVESIGTPRIDLHTGWGNIVLFLPDDISAEVSAVSSSPNGRIRSDFDLDIDEHRSGRVTATGTINGDDISVELVADGGAITIRSN